jgi:Phospholipase B
MVGNMKKLLVVASLVLAGLTLAPANRQQQDKPRMKHAFRRAQDNGWIYVHLEGTPSEIGYQHGYLLAPEIDDALQAVELSVTHDSKNWGFFRTAAQQVLWPHIEPQYREELQGIVDGVHARGGKEDLWDIVAMNAWLELSPYYVNWYDKQQSAAAKPLPTPEHCSAFVATGSYTKDGKVVIAHNNWADYLTGSRWNVIFDIAPAHGYHIIMDGMPGLIHSADDFGINSAGIMITETTISQFHGFDPNGIPEFVRARKAMQYSKSIDDFAAIMEKGNNGGYANDWLIADRNTNEIASLELGLKNVHLWRTKDGYFVGSNFPIDPTLAREETDFDVHDMSNSANARHVRWEQLMREYKGKIDVAAGKKFMADHYDSFEHKIAPSERTLCGHIDLSPRGSKPWAPPYGPMGTAEAKVSDASLGAQMSFWAESGHACGISFKAARHIQEHPQFAWQKSLLRDLNARPWTLFVANAAKN